MFVSANKFCGCWLKKFWSIRKALPFATPSRFRKHKRVLPRADRQRLKPCLRRPLNHQVIYCVRGVTGDPSGISFFQAIGAIRRALTAAYSAHRLFFLFAAIFFLCAYRQLSTRKFAHGSPRNDDRQLGQPTTSPV